MPASAWSEDALTIGIGFAGVAYRRHQVRHDDGACEGAGDIGDGARQRGAIAQVNVPVVGTQQGEAVSHGCFQAGKTVSGMLPEKPCQGTPKAGRVR
jgi:hypothetical protein